MSTPTSQYLQPNLPNNQPQQTMTLTDTGIYVPVIAAVTNGDIGVASFAIQCTTGSLTDVKLQVQFYPPPSPYAINANQSPWYDFLSASDWTSTTEYYVLKASSGNIATLSATSNGFSIIRLDGVYAFQLLAKPGTNPTVITANWFGKRARLGWG